MNRDEKGFVYLDSNCLRELNEGPQEAQADAVLRMFMEADGDPLLVDAEVALAVPPIQ